MPGKHGSTGGDKAWTRDYLFKNISIHLHKSRYSFEWRYYPGHAPQEVAKGTRIGPSMPVSATMPTSPCRQGCYSSTLIPESQWTRLQFVEKREPSGRIGETSLRTVMKKQSTETYERGILWLVLWQKVPFSQSAGCCCLETKTWSSWGYYEEYKTISANIRSHYLGYVDYLTYEESRVHCASIILLKCVQAYL